jgi:hypothetical protein
VRTASRPAAFRPLRPLAAAAVLLPVALSLQAHAHWRGGVWVGVAPAVPYGPPPAYVPPPRGLTPPRPPTFSWEAPPPVIAPLPPPLAYPPYSYPAPVPRVWVPPRWTGWGWIPGHWRYD